MKENYKCTCTCTTLRAFRLFPRAGTNDKVLAPINAPLECCIVCLEYNVIVNRYNTMIIPQYN